MFSNTIDTEFALIEFLYAQTNKQLTEKGHKFSRIEQIALIDEIVRGNFPKCLEYKISQLPTPPEETHDELD